MDRVDVLVLGIDASSAYLSRKLVEKGLSVTILDPRIEAGAPINTNEAVGGITLGFSKDIPEDLLNLHRLDEIKLYLDRSRDPMTFRVNGNSGDCIHSTLDQDRLDKEMAALAVMEGASLLIRSDVDSIREVAGGFETVFRQGSRVERALSRMVIAARPASILKDYISYGSYMKRQICVTRKTPGASASAEISLFEEVKMDYSWKLPKRHGIVNAGLESAGSCNEGRDSILVTKVEKNFKAGLFLQSGSVILTGQLLGLQDPIFSNDLDTSMLIARIAADVISSDIDSSPQDVVSAYRNRLKEHLLNKAEMGKSLVESISYIVKSQKNDVLDKICGTIIKGVKSEEMWKLIHGNIGVEDGS
ncbi:MAG: hypothetical protein QXV22_05340 [Thermoplasmataceae archaeon]